MLDFLKKVELFAGLPPADLERLGQIVEEVKLPAGQELFAEGSPGDRAYIIQKGELEVVKSSDGHEVLLEVHANKPGLVIGEMALLEEAPRMASVRACSDTVLLSIQKEQFEHILETSPTASRAMLRMILQRSRNNEARLRQSEKMAQLGTFTAGIAHELNNPAAAVKRSAEQLEAMITEFGQAQAQIDQLNLTQTQREILRDLTRQAQEWAVHPAELDVLARSDRESELEGWLEAHDIANAWELAPALVDMDFTVTKLAALAEHFSFNRPVDQLPTVLSWLKSTCTAHNLLIEIGQGAGRISDIVKALKSYAYLDQAPLQTVDVHEGLNNTLLILRHKFKSGISVRRHYAPDLPKFQAYGPELNQVWTNIIDNALDATAGQGEITIRTRQEVDRAVVEIEDDGPGIPLEIQSKIFDPFFTTKPPGHGTGLGLDISYNIIAHRHQGDIRVFSKPGRTCFQVWLPLNLEAK
jgi:signal transduction histidine kinase